MGSEVAGKARITSSDQRLFAVDADADVADDVAVRRISGNWCGEHENGTNRPLRLVEKESLRTLVESLYQVVIEGSESGTSLSPLATPSKEQRSHTDRRRLDDDTEVYTGSSRLLQRVTLVFRPAAQWLCHSSRSGPTASLRPSSVAWKAAPQSRAQGVHVWIIPDSCVSKEVGFDF